jgi:hypothetical protein
MSHNPNNKECKHNHDFYAVCDVDCKGHPCTCPTIIDLTQSKMYTEKLPNDWGNVGGEKFDVDIRLEKQEKASWETEFDNNFSALFWKQERGMASLKSVIRTAIETAKTEAYLDGVAEGQTMACEVHDDQIKYVEKHVETALKEERERLLGIMKSKESMYCESHCICEEIGFYKP